MKNTLKEPGEYLPTLLRLRERYPYAKNWKLELRKHTNRHKETNGGYWGWYEVHPLEIEVGYWGTGRDDLKEIDIDAWNEKAREMEAK